MRRRTVGLGTKLSLLAGGIGWNWAGLAMPKQCSQAGEPVVGVPTRGAQRTRHDAALYLPPPEPGAAGAALFVQFS